MDVTFCVIAVHLQQRDRLPGDSPEGRAEHGADVRAGLVEIAVLGLCAAGVGHVADGHGELRAAAGDLCIDPGLVDVERAVVDGAVGGVAPVSQDVEGQ
jgi:hypothetical protein